MSKHANEVKILMDLFAKFNGRMTKDQLLSELKETKMRQVYDYLYWATREQGIVFNAVRQGRAVVAYEHKSGSAQDVVAPTVTAKPVVAKSVKSVKAVKPVAKAAAKKAKRVSKPAKVVKEEAAKPVAKPVTEKVRKGEVASYSVDPEFDMDDALAIPDFLKR